MTNVIKVTAGSQTFRRSSGKLSVFGMLCDGTNKRELHSKCFASVGRGTQIMAHKNSISQHGSYFTQNFEADNSKVVCIQAQVSKNGAPYAEGMLFIALRDDGPLITVDFIPLPDRDSVIDSLEVFNGRGDVLSKDELAHYGIKLTKIQFKNFFNREEFDEVLSVTTISKGNEKPTIKVLESSTGEKRTVKVPSRAKRRLRLK